MPTIQGIRLDGRAGGPLAARRGSLVSYVQSRHTPRARRDHPMMTDNIFQKIIDRQLKADVVYEDDRCLAFRDTNPQAPVHVLIIPRKVIPTHSDVADADEGLL